MFTTRYLPKALLEWDKDYPFGLEWDQDDPFGFFGDGWNAKGIMHPIRPIYIYIYKATLKTMVTKSSTSYHKKV